MTATTGTATTGTATTGTATTGTARTDTATTGTTRTRAGTALAPATVLAGDPDRAVAAAVQLDWVVDAAPGWVGPVLFSVGLLVLMISTVYEVTATGGIFRFPAVAAVGAPALAVGGLAGVFATQPWVFVVVVTFVGRWIEGVAAIRLYQRAIEYVRSPRGVGPTGTGRSSDTLLYYAAVLFVVLAGLWAGVALVLFGPVLESLTYDLRVVWTLVTLTLALLGLARKVEPLNDIVATPILAGLVLAVAGTEVYNLALPAELLAYAVGGAGYFLGYWVAVYRLVSGAVEV